MTTSSPSAVPEWHSDLVWFSAACLLMAWIFQIAAAFGGNVHWWSPAGLSGASLMLASVCVRPTRQKLANVLIFASGFLGLASLVGVIAYGLPGSH